MIEIKNITSGFGKTEVLHGVSFDIERGKLTSVIGRNGSGKSTLLKTIVGIISANCGEILLDGESADGFSPKERAQRVAYLPQSKRTPDMTVFQAVLHGRFPHLGYPRKYSEKDRETAKAAMVAAGISEFADRRMDTLSGGMKQSVFVAMALAQDTDYILLDEPTAHLDISHQIELMKLLKKLAKDGRGIVAVMHDLPLAFAYSDEIVVIDDGHIAASGTPDEIVGSGVIKRVFGAEIIKSENGYLVKM